MFSMYIKMNTVKLITDGIGSKRDALNDIIKSIDSYNIDSVHLDEEGNTIHKISTESFGDESFLISQLEETPWFMKYVMVWNIDDNGLYSDMIDVERDIGVRCSYA